MYMKRLEKIWILFFSMSILGWIYETVLEVFVYHWGFSNRGILTGPWLPIYGVGGLLFIGVCYTVVKSDKNRGSCQVVVEFLIDKLQSFIQLTEGNGKGHGFSPRRGQLPVPLSQFACSFVGTARRTLHGSFARAVTKAACRACGNQP